MTALFEEMTISVYDFMQTDLDQSWDVALDVMHLHAIEERSHVGLDFKLLTELSKTSSKPGNWLRMQFLYPLLLYSQKRLQSSWKRAAHDFKVQEKLNRKQTRAISDRGITASDILGFTAYLKKANRYSFTGTGLLHKALQTIIDRQPFPSEKNQAH